MPTSPDTLAKIVITERQYVTLCVIRDLSAPDRYASAVSKAVDRRANRKRATNPATNHNTINRLTELGLLNSERDEISVGRGIPRRWLNVTALGNEVIEYFKDYKFPVRFIENESDPS